MGIADLSIRKEIQSLAPPYNLCSIGSAASIDYLAFEGSEMSAELDQPTLRLEGGQNCDGLVAGG
jgi:hypothetical protein